MATGYTNLRQTSPRPPVGKGKVGEPPKIPGEKWVPIRAAIFFDGTLNNRSNVERRIADPKILQRIEDGTSSSYGSYLSNVAILEYLNLRRDRAQHQASVYVEGIGTQNLKLDDRQGKAFGSGPTGIKDKVRNGIRDLRTQINQARKTNEFIEKITIDVFGFSRGAAAARHFVTSREAISTGWKQPKQPELIINFVGVFETVSSFEEGGKDMWGVVGNGLQGKTEGIFEDDVKELGLNLKDIPRRIVHLTAADEHRENFSLTTINSSLDAGVGFELKIPGVHSDVGGGYVEPDPQNPTMDPRQPIRNLNLEVRRISNEAEKKALIAQGWYTDGSVPGTPNQFVPWTLTTTSPVNKRKVTVGGYHLFDTPAIRSYSPSWGENGVRYLTTEYQFVPLALMRNLATRELGSAKTKAGPAGPFEKLQLESLGLAKNKGYRVPAPLQPLYQHFAAVVEAKAGSHLREEAHFQNIAQRNMVRNKYLHRSAVTPTTGVIDYLANASTSDGRRHEIDDRKMVDKIHKRVVPATKKAASGAAQRVREALPSWLKW
jgi:hypothetical protein